MRAPRRTLESSLGQVRRTPGRWSPRPQVLSPRPDLEPAMLLSTPSNGRRDATICLQGRMSALATGWFEVWHGERRRSPTCERLAARVQSPHPNCERDQQVSNSIPGLGVGDDGLGVDSGPSVARGLRQGKDEAVGLGEAIDSRTVRSRASRAPLPGARHARHRLCLHLRPVIVARRRSAVATTINGLQACWRSGGRVLGRRDSSVLLTLIV
jgi:hypothetical protein